MCTGTSASRTPYGPDPCPAQNWTAAELQERFAYMDAQLQLGHFSQINLWVLPLLGRARVRLPESAVPRPECDPDAPTELRR